jgi:hypothetical protein
MYILRFKAGSLAGMLTTGFRGSAIAYDYGPSTSAVQKIRIIQTSSTQYQFYLQSGWYNTGTILTVTGPGFEYIGSELNTATAPVASAGQYFLDVGAYRIWSSSKLNNWNCQWNNNYIIS